MFKLLRKGTKSDFYTIAGILLLCLFRTTLSLYLDLDNSQQMGLNALISILILVIVLISLKSKIKNQQELNIKENLLKGLLQESRATLNKIISSTQDTSAKESAMQLTEMIANIRTFNTVKSDTNYQPEQLLKRSKVNKNLRKGIVAILMVLAIGSLFIYTNMVVELVESKMIHAIDVNDSEAFKKFLGKNSYIFQVDETGTIFNHPNSDFNTLNIKSTIYLDSYLSGKSTIITDYNDSWSVCLIKKNAEGGYNIVVADWWTMYGSSLLLGIILFLIFLLCIIIVDLFIDRLFDWQDSVNNQLKQAIDDAVAAGKAKSQFFAQMSHEIRTPINAVIGMNEMILRECRDAAIIKYAQNAHAASEALLSLINDILDFSKLESEKMELVEETYQLDELIRNLINMIKFRAEKKSLDFRVKVNENIPNELFGDSTRIRQVVVNFLTNAVKYTKVGGIMFTVDMELGLDEDTGATRQMGELLLKFSVKDSGIGIRDEDKSKLFKDFERFDAKQNKNIEGTGLGLAITAKLVKMMRGKIEVESVYGEGSTFTVLVPQKVIGKKGVGKFEEKVKAEKPKTDAYRVSFVAPNAKILVVDDNEMNLLVATSLLKATKIQVDTAMSGMSALKKMAEKKYDIVFLDQMMPSLDGIQTLKLAKEMKENKSPNIPMIALTANAISGAKEMFLKEGFTDYLMLAEYLPKELLQEPPEEGEAIVSKPAANYSPPPPNNSFNVPPPYNSSVPTATAGYSLLNPAVGLQYSAGMEDMYRDVLTMFCKLKDEKKAKIQEAFNSKNWNDYTTFVHALKSTSLSIGSEQTSALAKQLEESGKILIASSTSELDKQQAEEFISSHQAEAMELYDKLVEEGRRYLGLPAGESIQQSANIAQQPVNTVQQTAPAVSAEEQTDEEDNGLEFMLSLQDAFENEDWVKYSKLILDTNNNGEGENANIFKQVNMACRMIISDLTSDSEKAEAIKYIKDNHATILEMF